MRRTFDATSVCDLPAQPARPSYAGPLFDLQVNGYAGVSFSSLDLTRGSFELAARKILGDGLKGFLPTVRQCLQHVEHNVVKSSHDRVNAGNHGANGDVRTRVAPHCCSY